MFQSEGCFGARFAKGSRFESQAHSVIISRVFFIDAGSHGSKPVHGGRIAQDRGTTEATEIREQKEEEEEGGGGGGGEKEEGEEEDDDKVSGRGREERTLLHSNHDLVRQASFFSHPLSHSSLTAPP